MNVYIISLVRASIFFLVLNVDSILLATNDLNLLCDTKKFLSNNFEMKDLGNASYVLGIQIYRDHSKDILGLSQKGYIEKPLQRYNMQDCKPLDTPIPKGDKLSLSQCQKNVLEIPEMEKFLYAQVVVSLMYIQVLFATRYCLNSGGFWVDT